MGLVVCSRSCPDGNYSGRHKEIVGGEVKGWKKTKLVVGGGGKGVMKCQSLVPRCLKCVARI